MAKRYYIIEQDDVRATCLPNAQFDTNVFQPHIEPAELQYIKPFLGADFYDPLVVEYLAGTLTAANENLLANYLKPMLAWYVYAKASPFMHISTKSGGFFVNNSEFSQGASSQQRNELYVVIIQNAEALADKAKKFIEDNATLYPLYEVGGNIDNNTSFTGGLILDKE